MVKISASLDIAYRFRAPSPLASCQTINNQCTSILESGLHIAAIHDLAGGIAGLRSAYPLTKISPCPVVPGGQISKHIFANNYFLLSLF
jgi:hypothetical protein